jgi:hypothetical protein
LLQYHKIKTSSWGEFFDTVAAVNIKINGSWRAVFLYTTPEKSSLQVACFRLIQLVLIFSLAGSLTILTIFVAFCTPSRHVWGVP